MQFTTVKLKIGFKFHSITTCIKRKILGNLPSASTSKEVKTKLGKPLNHQYVFPNCLSDFFPFSHRTCCTSTYKTGNVHLSKTLLNVTRLKVRRWPPWCAPEPPQAAQCSAVQPRSWAGHRFDNSLGRSHQANTDME